MSHFAHPIPAEWLTAYYDGELDPRRSAQVDAHLPECAECRQELAELKALRQTLRSVALPPAALAHADEFWSRVQARLPERQPPAPAMSTRRVLLHWSPGIALLLLNGVVQVLAVAGAAFLVLTGALGQAPAWAARVSQLVTGFTLGVPTWLLPANWGGWELAGFWLMVTAELAVLYVAWLGYELRYGPLPTFARARAAKGD